MAAGGSDVHGLFEYLVESQTVLSTRNGTRAILTGIGAL